MRFRLSGGEDGATISSCDPIRPMRAPIPFSSVPLPVPRSPVIRSDVPLYAIDARAWNALAPAHPFLSHAFFSALHETGCASRETGWQARFVTAWSDGMLVGAMPLYAKAHSYGEYVFDWGWADAYHRHGLSYYPKLLGAIPFSPVTGPLLLARDGETRALLVRAALRLSLEVSSLHVLFPAEPEAREMEAAGMMLRRSVQFHWENRGYANFDQFLSDLASAKRKKIPRRGDGCSKLACACDGWS